MACKKLGARAARPQASAELASNSFPRILNACLKQKTNILFNNSIPNHNACLNAFSDRH